MDAEDAGLMNAITATAFDAQVPFSASFCAMAQCVGSLMRAYLAASFSHADVIKKGLSLRRLVGLLFFQNEKHVLKFDRMIPTNSY